MFLHKFRNALRVVPLWSVGCTQKLPYTEVSDHTRCRNLCFDKTCTVKHSLPYKLLMQCVLYYSKTLLEVVLIAILRKNVRVYKL